MLNDYFRTETVSSETVVAENVKYKKYEVLQQGR